MPQKTNSLLHPFFDFWLLGGASIVILLIMTLVEGSRESIPSVQEHVMQIASAFGLFTLICNHPHFMISYRFGYGQGTGFILKHWFSLIFVPLSMVALYLLAYFSFHTNIADSASIYRFNQITENWGFAFHLGHLEYLGAEILSYSVWLMYLTVGWHYSKQVFGCIMVYARYDNYQISKLQRIFIKSSVFSVAFFNFIYMVNYMSQLGAENKMFFFSLPLAPATFPVWASTLSKVWVGASTFAVLYFVVIRNYQTQRKLPSLNGSIAWLAFYLWWIPIVEQPVYYLLMVPFFHSLQYLPFAYRREKSKFKLGGRWMYLQITFRVALLLAVGFMVFEFVPNLLDLHLHTDEKQTAWFFSIAFIVFVNVHHFFIDSVSWRFTDREAKESIFPA